MKIQDRYSEEDFSDFLNDVINSEELEGKELGITKLVLDKGYDKLTDKQKYVFDEKVVKYFYIEKCERCFSEIPWSEMFYAYDYNHLCGYCEHVYEKMMKE
ncbi:MAG: hypothetical protein GXO80_12165 [Chlorobi bacterium]|nr:hypothetical protein [Chlorobiota bacterium]